MKQIVSMKVVPKTEQVRLDPDKRTLIREGVENEINEADKNALELALRVKDRFGGEVTALSMGPPFFDPYLKLAVAMGADDAVLLSDRAFAGADVFPTSMVIATAMKRIPDFDLIYCGEASSDSSTEQVPPGVAEWLDIPQITYVTGLNVQGGKVIATRSARGGHETVEATMPALISVSIGSNPPRFPDFRRKKWAEKELKPNVWGREDLGLPEDKIGVKGSCTVVEELKPVKAHGRLNEHISGDSEQVAKRLVEIIRGVM